MKRYMISPIIGTGTEQDHYRVAVADVAYTSAIIPTDHEGRPNHNFAFCYAGSLNLTAALQIGNAYAFPDYSLDGRMDGMAPDQRLNMVQSVEAYVLDAEDLHFDLDFITDAMSYRDVLTTIARQLEPAFTMNGFDVREAE